MPGRPWAMFIDVSGGISPHTITHAVEFRMAERQLLSAICRGLVLAEAFRFNRDPSFAWAWLP